MRAGGTKLFHSAPKEVDFPPTLPLRKNADMRTHSHKLKGKVMFKKTGALGLQRQTVEFKREIKILSLRSAPGRKSYFFIQTCTKAGNTRALRAKPINLH